MKDENGKRVITLVEYETRDFERDAIPEDLLTLLWNGYKEKIEIEFPSIKTGYKLKLKPRGYVGCIPLSQDLYIYIEPKVPLRNLFGMLEYAYEIPFLKPGTLHSCSSIEEFFERLAHILAKRILDRSRKGFYRAYLPHRMNLPYIRGKLDFRSLMNRPGEIKLRCLYHEYTVDVDENRILAWTLFLVIRSGLCAERVLPTIRKAFRLLQGVVELRPYAAQDCIERRYNRLNDDYEQIHVLCGFFLEHSGPSIRPGERRMLPFLVDMAGLFEKFAAEWLKNHVPSGFEAASQKIIPVGERFKFRIDLTLIDKASQKTAFVLDTKYKKGPPLPNDVSQVVTYAEATGCTEAILIYPTRLQEPLDENIGRIRVRSLAFSLDDDLEQAGEAFLRDLLEENPRRA